jgi:hypothetical protein
MCAVLIRLMAVLSVLALFPFAADVTSAGDAGSDCGNPSDIHDGWSIGSPEQQGVDRIRLCAMGKGMWTATWPTSIRLWSSGTAC